MPQTVKNWTVVPVAADEISETPAFYVMEGRCRKCDVGNNTLIITSFRTNEKDKNQSIFRTTCLVCGTKNMLHYSKDVDRKL